LAENPGKIYIIELDYTQGNLSLQSIGTRSGFATDRRIQPDNGYRCDVMSSSGLFLESFKFDIPLRVYYDNFDQNTGKIMGGGVQQLESVNFTLSIQYFKNAKSINFYDPNGTLLLSADVSKFSESTTTRTSITPPNKNPGSVMNYAIYIPLLLILLLAAFLTHRKLKAKRIEKQREEFGRWKSEQEKDKKQ